MSEKYESIVSESYFRSYCEYCGTKTENKLKYYDGCVCSACIEEEKERFKGELSLLRMGVSFNKSNHAFILAKFKPMHGRVTKYPWRIERMQEAREIKLSCWRVQFIYDHPLTISYFFG